MAYTETTTTSYGGRLSRSLKGIVGGLIAFIAGTALPSVEPGASAWKEANFVRLRCAMPKGATAPLDSPTVKAAVKPPSAH